MDASRLGAASGCGVVLDLDAIPIADAAHRLVASAETEATALDRALGDGEDFELLLAVREDVADALLKAQPLDVALTQIGELTAETGLWGRHTDGELVPLPPLGYQHMGGGPA